MSTSVKGIISKNNNLESIVDYIENSFSKAEVNTASNEDYCTINFVDDEDRMLSVFFGDFSLHDYDIEGVIISLGSFGRAEEIIKQIVDHFGGYYRRIDYEEFVPIGIEKFVSAESSENDIFVNKIINKLGYKNLKEALKLFDEYHKILTNQKEIYGRRRSFNAR